MINISLEAVYSMQKTYNNRNKIQNTKTVARITILSMNVFSKHYKIQIYLKETFSEAFNHISIGLQALNVGCMFWRGHLLLE